MALAAALFIWVHAFGLLCAALCAVGAFWIIIPGHGLVYGPHLWLRAILSFLRTPLDRPRHTAGRHRFIVLALRDCDDYGFEEHTLPALATLMHAAAPEHRQSIATQVTGYFLTSRDALTRVRGVIEQVERLCAADSRLRSLGIGLAEGPLIADLSMLSKSSDLPPLGTVANEATRSAKVPHAYRQTLQRLADEFPIQGTP